MGPMHVPLIVLAAFLLPSLAGCIVPESMTALREELGYASIDPPPDAVVKARASTLTPRIHEAVTLTAAIEGVSAALADITWDLGDGSTASGDRVVHAWDATGPHEVRVVARLASGLTVQDSLPITVRHNAPPLPVITVESRDGLVEGTPVALSALGTTDADGDALGYAWLIDGALELAGPRLERALSAGVHHAQLTVTDGFTEVVAFDSFGVAFPIASGGRVTATAPGRTASLTAGPGAGRLVVDLEHTTLLGVDDVDLVLLDEDGAIVASSATVPGAGDSRGKEHLETAQLAPGAYTLEARLVRGVEADISIEGVLTYSPLAATR